MLSLAPRPAEGAPGSPIYQLSLTAENAPARTIAAWLESEAAPPALCVSIFEIDEHWMEVTALYEALPERRPLFAMLEDFASGLGKTARLELVPAQDWVTLSQGLRGKVAAGRFVVHGSHEPLRRAPGIIEIDASQAFGTAHHASTKGCLLALDEILKRRKPRLVFDIGTGSGVLAIAAARVLRACFIASDDDPTALAIAEDNAAKNRVRGIRFVLADGFEHPVFVRAKADLVFGNLLKSILFSLTPGFAAHTAPGGLAVLSGITTDQAPSVAARFTAFGFCVWHTIAYDGWTTLILKRRKP